MNFKNKFLFLNQIVNSIQVIFFGDCIFKKMKFIEKTLDSSRKP